MIKKTSTNLICAHMGIKYFPLPTLVRYEILKVLKFKPTPIFVQNANNQYNICMD